MVMMMMMMMGEIPVLGRTERLHLFHGPLKVLPNTGISHHHRLFNRYFISYKATMKYSTYE